MISLTSINAVCSFSKWMQKNKWLQKKEPIYKQYSTDIDTNQFEKHLSRHFFFLFSFLFHHENVLVKLKKSSGLLAIL